MCLLQDEGSADIRPEVRVWEAGTGRLVRTFAFREGSVNSVVFTPDSRRLAAAGGNSNKYLSLAAWDLASAGGDQTVRVWDVVTLRERLCYRGHSASVYGVCFSPDGKRICSAAEGLLRIWDAQTGADVRSLAGHRYYISCVSFTPDGQLVSGSYDTTLKLWPRGTGLAIRE